MAGRFLDKEREGFISFIEARDNLFKGKNYYLASDWEENLTSDYWKNWREKVKTFQNKEEFSFFCDKVLKLRSYVLWVIRYYRGDRYDASHIRKLVEIKERKLENISQEDFKKEDKFADLEFKELSTKEMLNDPWFNKEIDNFFGLENRKLPKEEEKPVEKNGDNNINYQTWTREQLISEINRLKAENEELRDNQTLNTSERQERLQQNQQKLEQVQNIFDSNDTQQSINNSNKNFPTGWVIGGGILAIIGLTALFIIRNKKKRKRL